MKLEFNPKVISEDEHSIYLLDEPGSYLHAFAQRKLCLKLRQISEKNKVIYCTHSHYLLDPEQIAVNSIMVADKDGDGQISLTRMIDYSGTIKGNRSALQPVMDALQIKPYALDLIHAQTTVIVEGIYDYFCLEMFRGERKISILPSVGADSIKFYISLMIAWQVDFRALWDNDTEGKNKHSQASKLFGDDIASRWFRLLPPSSTGGHRIMQDMFEGTDLVAFRQALQLQNNCSFEQTLQALFYSSLRSKLVGGVSEKTKKNFALLFEHLSLDKPPAA